MGNIGAVKRFIGVCWAAIAVVVGWNVAGAVHELGHAAATLALGGKISRIQLWYCLGRTETLISNLSDGKVAIILLSGMLANNLLGVGALLAVPWSRLSGSTWMKHWNEGNRAASGRGRSPSPRFVGKRFYAPAACSGQLSDSDPVPVPGGGSKRRLRFRPVKAATEIPRVLSGRTFFRRCGRQVY